MTLPPAIYVGCAGWSVPRQYADHFPITGSHLERYGQVLPAVEINSSFYRPHRPVTYTRWAASVPEAFRFAVKVPREITHMRRLRDVNDQLNRFLDEVSGLEEKCGPLLVQLPPSLRFDADVTEAFFTTLGARFNGNVVCEPRHESWFTGAADDLLATLRVARVAADPAPVPEAATPGGWHGLVYYRLHGSPEMYTSDYSEAYLEALADAIEATKEAASIWCIFDNTVLGAATGNALWLWKRFENASRQEA